MDCKTTFISRGRGRAGGFSIIENWVAIAIFGILMAAVMGFSLYTGKSFAGLSNYVDLEQRSQLALDRMTKDIRMTQYLASFNTNQLVFQDNDGTPLTFTYNAGDKTLVRSKGGTNQVLLTECDFLSFSNYQRNPIAGTYEQFPTTLSATNTKLVSVTWVCSRKITGTKMNTESVQTAKIVIRKQ
ncbi:MAG: hypothetical protein HZA90_20460 [Verrucomicrobia bacterium]|nr:hypothetical protein [Verrucomicrobiota bacterium]